MVKSKARVSESVGFISRIDFGSPGYRRGLLELAFDVFRKEKVRFIVIAGGLVSSPNLRPTLTANKKPEEKEALFQEWAHELAEAIPHLTNEDGKPVKIYIITSHALNYDGVIGKEIAIRLHDLRPQDILYQGEGSARFPMPKMGKIISVLVPIKASWRGGYYSTVVQRLIDDKEKQSAQKFPDIYVIGGTASSILRPKGEMKRPHISLPALHNLKEVNTSENQVGIRVLEVFKDSPEPLVRTYSCKDLVSYENERASVLVPDSLPKVQQDILNELKRQGPASIGMLEDALQPSRETIEKAIKAINANGFNPRIIFDETSGKYQFDSEWFARELRYSLPEGDGVGDDRVLAFSCLHAGSVYTEMKFFVNEVPDLILRHNVRTLIDCGDNIQGLKHDLSASGEVIDGTNYTDHERLAANLCAAVITKVFSVRFTAAIGKMNIRAKQSRAVITQAINDSLLLFNYIDGNHDEWVVPLGMSSLAIFRLTLIEEVVSEIYSILIQNKISFEGDFLKDIVEKHIVKSKILSLPSSGLTVDVSHPHMGRASTSSLRSQEMLRKSQCHICMIGNFHTAIAIEQWDSEFGQRVAIQQCSIVWKTGFEEGHTKILDVVVSYLHVKSANGRIFMTEAMYYGSGTENPDLSKSDPLEGI